MTRSEKNVAIAKALGFRWTSWKVNGKERGQWHYPKEWEHLLYSGGPNRQLPDFLGMIERTVSVAKSFRGLAPHDYGTEALLDAERAQTAGER